MAATGKCVALVCLALAGCTAEGERYDPTRVGAAGNTGIIYVYREEGTIWARGESPLIQIDGKSYGQLKAGGYIRAALPEGEHKVTVMQTLFLVVPTIPKSVTVAVVPASRSYVKVDQRITSFGQHGTISATQETMIEEVDPATGQSELQKSRAN